MESEKSIYTGVFTFITYKNFKKKWIARIKNPIGKRINIGYYQTQNEAAQAYNEKAIEFYGDKATLNEIIITPETIAKNPNWLTTNIGKCWRQLSKKEVIEIIKSNTIDKNREDNELIIKFIEGDENAFGSLYTKYHSEFLRAIKGENNKRTALSGSFKNPVHGRNKGRNISYGETPLDYEDIITDGIMKIMRALKKGRFQGIYFLAFACKIMRNTWNDYTRKKYKLRCSKTRQREKMGRNFINRNKSKLISIENSGY